jgi:hypothetical protein
MDHDPDMPDRRCFDCGAPASWLLQDKSGVVKGFVCTSCHAKRRRHRRGWRRLARRVRRTLRL